MTLFKRVILHSGLILGLASMMGCSTIGGWLGFGDKPPKVDGSPALKYSDNSEVPPTTDRAYRHMTKQRMEDEAQLQSNAGSMWVMEGQSSYLFSQNKTRREGDLLNVKLEGAAQKQVDTKVSVIKKLLKQLEEEARRSQQLQGGGGGLADSGTPAAQPARAPANAAGAAGAPAAADAEKKPEKEKDEEIKIDSVPTKIVERQPDGNYRVKGQQPFMIGTKEYKVIVTGIIRPEDFNDEGVSSNKILDPQYDVVSLRRKE